MKNVKISVIMSVYSELFLDESITSILNQTFHDFEFIIINDNPTNNSLNQKLTNYTKKDKRILLIKNDKNMGLGASLNRGLTAVRGEFIARMDSDDIALPNRFEKQINFLHQHKEISLIGSWAERITENGESHGIMKLPKSPELLSKMLKYTTAAYHPTWMFRASILEKIGKYREFPVAQDYDFMWRCIDNDILISNIQEVLLKYRISNSSASVNKFLQQWIIRKYIYSLHKERVKYGKDSFTIQAMQKKLKINKIEKRLASLSQLFFEKSVIAKRKQHRISFILNLIFSIIIYPPKISVLYSTFRSKLLQKKKEGNIE